MNILTKLIAKTATVEEIHESFDSAQDRILEECDKILADLKIPTETQIERKAKMMEELGFVNSETVQQAKSLFERGKEIKQKIDITAKQAETIRYFKEKYPFEKFITTEELDKICNKYNLIHAPVANYVKDIPEKNVLEMKNCKKLDKNDQLINQYQITDIIFWSGATSEYQKWVQNNIIGKYLGFDINNSESIFGELCKDFKGVRGSDYWFNKISCEKIDKSGLFIAAPNSHFNLENLSKKSKFGFFKVEITEVKDPVVFEYCKDGIVRIISKWGIPGEDKAYLDPILQNEILN